MKHNRMIAGTLALILAFGSGGCSFGPDDFNASQKGATEATRQKNEEVYRQLDFNNKDEINAAAKGLLDSPESLEIKDEDGSVIWSQKAFSFVTEDTPSPDTVHPGLWSNAQMNRYYGLFQVHDRIFQVRGYDVTNLTLIAGDTGWIIIDPMSNAEAMRAALELIEKDIDERPIAAVIYTAASVNHYGGVGALLEDAAAAIPIIAPRGFGDAAGTENLFTENSSRRQSEYLYGSLLPAGAQGSLFIGKDETTTNGTSTYLAPNDFIQETGETREIDGVEIQFQLSENTTGNVAMNLYFPDTKCLWLSENCSGTLHDLYDVTGEKSSRPDQWVDFLTETYALYGSQAEIVIEAHNWPHWGKDVIRSYLSNLASAYQYVFDQTLHLMNQGYTESEIVQSLALPKSLAQSWYLRQYCSSLGDSIRTVYQSYQTASTLNPVDLNPLTETEAARRLVEYLGDVTTVLKRAEEDFAKGDYQWVVQITNILIQADPNNQQARYLCADALEQLGYQCESVLWRNAYLTGAKELREGAGPQEVKLDPLGQKAQHFLSGEAILDYMGTLVDKDLANGKEITFLLTLTDDEETYTVQLKNSVLLVYPGVVDKTCKNKITTTSSGLFAILNQDTDRQALLLEVEGEENIPSVLAGCLKRPSDEFNVVIP